MYAISLHGSKSEYLADLEKMFCKAPTTTASMRGVVPRAATSGASADPPISRLKKRPPVMAMTDGVTRAAKPHPKIRKILRDSNIMPRVTVPVHAEKAPINSE